MAQTSSISTSLPPQIPPRQPRPGEQPGHDQNRSASTPRAQHHPSVAASYRHPQEARATIAAYANHIQALSLRNAELEAENATLREALHQGGGTVASLPVTS